VGEIAVEGAVLEHAPQVQRRRQCVGDADADADADADGVDEHLAAEAEDREVGAWVEADLGVLGVVGEE